MSHEEMSRRETRKETYPTGVGSFCLVPRGCSSANLIYATGCAPNAPRAVRTRACRSGGGLRLNCSAVLAAFCLLVPEMAQCRPSEDSVARTMPDKPSQPPVEREIVMIGMASYGNWRILAGGRDCKLFTAGFEYDRHSWGYFLKARMDYVAEVLPFVLLREPAKADIWGDPLTTAKKTVPGLGISPIGMRMMWFDKTAVKPYFMFKGGLIGFPEKVLSTKATYESLSLQLGIGMQVRMTDRTDLRLGLFNDFHFSDAFIVPVNPGLDVMNASFGVSYHLANATPREHHRHHGLFRAAAAQSQTPQ